MDQQIVSDMPDSLHPDLLRRVCSEEEVIDAQNTSALDDLFVGVAQERLLQTLDLALGESSKNNVFIAGISGPRALNAVKTYVTQYLKAGNSPSTAKDWCYLYNFDTTLEPIVIATDKGKGKALKERMSKVLEELRERIPAALVRDEVVAEREQIHTAFQSWRDVTSAQIIHDAKEEGILVVFGEQTMVYIIDTAKEPEVKEGRKIIPTLDSDARDALPAEKLQALDAVQNKWVHRVRMTFVEDQRRGREASEGTVELNRRVVREAVDSVFKKFRIVSSEQATAYGDKLKNFAIDNFAIFTEEYRQQQQESRAPQQNMFIPWTINVLVDNSEREIPPVVVDYDGTFQDLVGRVERVGGNYGVLYTDHTMISAGSIADANGGYLIVDAMNVLRNTGSYDVIKRVLNNGILKIEDLMSFYGMGSTIPLQPRPIPVNIKVIMIGSRHLWDLLAHYDDPEFLDHFELKAEVAPEVARTPQETSALAAWTRQYARANQLLTPENGALQRLVEHTGRLADSQQRLSTDFRELEPVVSEASHLAKRAGADVISAGHVRQALERKFYRSDLYYRRWQEMIRDKKIILPLKGTEVGQMTILAVMDFGDIRLGFPGRLTCTWAMGRPGFVSIERESKMAGKILHKGELTVQGYLKSLFAKNKQLALEVTYTAEQTYSMVDGDSASMALFYCIISSLADVPIRQDIAITGSMSQRGEPQPIGGVNEKIEGFFDCCTINGLTGTQGVIIPRSNAGDLMLNERVVEAVASDAFHIWAIDDIAQGARILMGMDAGSRLPGFAFTPGSLFDLVDKQLFQIARTARNFSKEQDDMII